MVDRAAERAAIFARVAPEPTPAIGVDIVTIQFRLPSSASVVRSFKTAAASNDNDVSLQQLFDFICGRPTDRVGDQLSIATTVMCFTTTDRATGGVVRHRFTAAHDDHRMIRDVIAATGQHTIMVEVNE